MNALDEVLEALRMLLAEPYGCSLCDSGKMRNPKKGHQPDCPYENAKRVIQKNLGHDEHRKRPRPLVKPIPRIGGVHAGGENDRSIHHARDHSPSSRDDK